MYRENHQAALNKIKKLQGRVEVLEGDNKELKEKLKTLSTFHRLLNSIKDNAGTVLAGIFFIGMVAVWAGMLIKSCKHSELAQETCEVRCKKKLNNQYLGTQSFTKNYEKHAICHCISKTLIDNSIVGVQVKTK